MQPRRDAAARALARAAEEQLRRYEMAASLSRSFVDDQPSIKWCPHAPDCGLAVRGEAGRPLGAVQCSQAPLLLPVHAG